MTTYYCEKCDSKMESIPMNPHAPGAWDNSYLQCPECKCEDGIEKHECCICGKLTEKRLCGSKECASEHAYNNPGGANIPGIQ